MLLTVEDHAAGFDYPASSRFGTALAPTSLVLSQELANTIGLDHLPHFVDLLSEIDTAQNWIDAVLPHWCASFGAEDPHLHVTAAELPRLRAVRDTLRSVLGDHDDPRTDDVINRHRRHHRHHRRCAPRTARIGCRVVGRRHRHRGRYRP